MLLDCKIELSEELATKILTGQDRIPTEAIVRGQAGKYDQFIPLKIVSKEAEEKTAVAANNSSNSLSIQNNALIGLGIGVLALAVTGLAVGLTIYYKNKKKAVLAENQAEFNRCLQVYIDEAKNGKLQLKTLDDLICAIDNISHKDKNGAVVLTITVDEFMELVKAVYDYTKKMAAQKSLIIKDFELSTQENSVKEFRHCLELQRKIMLKAA